MSHPWVFLWLSLSIYWRRATYLYTEFEKHLAAMSNVPNPHAGSQGGEMNAAHHCLQAATPRFSSITLWATRRTFLQDRETMMGVNPGMYFVFGHKAVLGNVS